MKRAMQVSPVSNRAARDAVGMGGSVQAMVPLPPDPWYIRGPRGGLYVATGTRERFFDDQMFDAFIRNMTNVVDRSEGLRYLRPGTRAYREAVGGGA